MTESQADLKEINSAKIGPIKPKQSMWRYCSKIVVIEVYIYENILLNITEEKVNRTNSWWNRYCETRKACHVIVQKIVVTGIYMNEWINKCYLNVTEGKTEWSNPHRNKTQQFKKKEKKSVWVFVDCVNWSLYLYSRI